MIRPLHVAGVALAFTLGLAASGAEPGDATAPVFDPKLQVPATVAPLFDTWMRNAFVTSGPDGFYYLTGSTAAPGRMHCWDWNDGIRLWRSRDLRTWEPLGLVWDLDRDATWQRRGIRVPSGQSSPMRDILGPRRRAVWSPEIHYIEDRHEWLIVACMNGGQGAFILRSTSGAPQGPYVNIAGNASGALVRSRDASLFADDDGAVYFVANRTIARMKPDLTDLAESPRPLDETEYDPEPYSEAASIVKAGGRYHLIRTFWSFKKPDGRYSYLGPHYNHPSRYSCDVVVASADHVYGPYGPRYTAIIDAGINSFFQDRDGRWWSTMFGNPRSRTPRVTSFVCRPALVPLQYRDGRFAPGAAPR